MSREIAIGGRLVGAGSPCFVIAEAGVNHNGSVEAAKKLVDAAKDSGADAVKFQTFRAEELATSQVERADYQKHPGENGGQLQMLRKLQLNEQDFNEISAHCSKKRIIFLSTPFDFKSADLLERLAIPAYKVSSSDLNNYPFLSYIARKGKPVIISTGMADMGEIEKAINSIRKEGNSQIIVLQCTSAYPAPFHEINLNVMKTLSQKFGFPTGFSDHTQGIEISIAAVALGACMVEKHFTLDKNMPGPDHKASINPDELKALVKSIRNVEAALGSSEKRLMPSEASNRQVARKRVVAATEIKRGEAITEGSLALKRSSHGSEPSELQNIIGKKARKDIHKDEPIDMSALEG